MGTNGAHKDGINRVAAAERQRQALKLRAGGATLQTIADRLGYASASGAAKAVNTALRTTLQEPADALRVLEMVRLDALQIAVWPKAMTGDLGAVDRALKIMERRARLMGLDAPAVVNVSHGMAEAAQHVAEAMGLDPADVIAEAERIVAALGLHD